MSDWEAETMSDGYTGSTVAVAGLSMQVRRGGEGPGVFGPHHETGNACWFEFHNDLAGSRDVILPNLPKWDSTKSSDCMRSARNIEAVCDPRLDELGIGDYVAAEMATANQSGLAGLVLDNAVVNLLRDAGPIATSGCPNPAYDLPEALSTAIVR